MEETTEKQEIIKNIEILEFQHREIDIILKAHGLKKLDAFTYQKLKKQKLVLKDQISCLRSLLNHDLLA
jgi:hypothetical protein